MEFEQQFATEKACREYLFELRWPDGFQCPRCENRKAWKTSQGNEAVELRGRDW